MEEKKKGPAFLLGVLVGDTRSLGDGGLRSFHGIHPFAYPVSHPPIPVVYRQLKTVGWATVLISLFDELKLGYKIWDVESVGIVRYCRF